MLKFVECSEALQSSNCLLQGGNTCLFALWPFSSDLPVGGVLSPACLFICLPLGKHKPSVFRLLWVDSWISLTD